MSFFSKKTAMVRFKTNGDLGENPTEIIRNGLASHIIKDITTEPDEIMIGWTNFKNPYTPSFNNPSSYEIGNFFIFGLRIDKKQVPGKSLVAQYQIAEKQILEENKRDFLSKTEKKELKENVKASLLSNVIPTPNVYEIVWDYENSLVAFFSTQKGAICEFETLFSKSFNINLIRLFPYTIVSLDTSLSNQQKELIINLQQSSFKDI